MAGRGSGEDENLASNDGDGRQRVPERWEGALLAVVAEGRAGPLQLVDEGDQVLHGRRRREGEIWPGRERRRGRLDRDAEDGWRDGGAGGDER